MFFKLLFKQLIDGLKQNWQQQNDNQHHGLTNRWPLTSQLYWPIRSIARVYTINATDVIQLTFTLKMTTAQVIEMSATVNNNP